MEQELEIQQEIMLEQEAPRYKFLPVCRNAGIKVIENDKVNIEKAAEVMTVFL